MLTRRPTVVTSRTVTARLIAEARERQNNPSEIYGYAHYGYPDKWKQLNAITGGIQVKEMHILAARMKVGKSMFAADLIPLIAAQVPEGQVLRIVSLEMGVLSYQRRMASMLANIPDPNRILKGTLTPDELDNYEQALEYIADLPIEYWTSPINTEELRAFIGGVDMTGRGGEKKPTFYWVLDHAGLVGDVAGASSNYQKYVSTANAIMSICHDIATGLVITHANRATPDGIPTQDNLAGTDAYGKNYDVLMLLARPLMNATPDVVEAMGGEDLLSVGEPARLNVTSRSFGSGTVWLWWSSRYARFTEMNDEDIAMANQMDRGMKGAKSGSGKL